MIDVPERRPKFLYLQLRGGQPNLSRNTLVSGSASEVYTRQNNYLNNSEPQVGEGYEFHGYTGARQT